jgi:hypothetical protein
MTYHFRGRGKGKKVGNYGNLSITLGLDGLGDIYEKHGFENQQGAKKLKIIVSEMREADKYGNTHTVYVDTWKPGGRDE